MIIHRNTNRPTTKIAIFAHLLNVEKGEFARFGSLEEPVGQSLRQSPRGPTSCGEEALLGRSVSGDEGCEGSEEIGDGMGSDGEDGEA